MASLEADNLGLPVTGTESGGKRGIDINISSSDVALGGGTQYTEGDTDASITGTAMMMEGGANALVPAQGTTTDGLLVNLGTNNDVTGTVTANAGTNLNTSALALEAGGNLAAAATSLAIIDDWDESDRAKVNPIVGQAGVQGDSGAVSANTQRVVLATDVALPAGTNAIGKLASNSGVTIGAVEIAAAQTLATVTTVSTLTGGGVAHDGVDSGNPVKIGYKAKAFDGTEPGTAVAEDDRVDAIADPYGRQYVSIIHPRFWDTSADYASAQTNVQIKAAPGASLKLYVTDIIVSNGATAGKITLLDGSGGTVKITLYPGVNGGAVANLKHPIVLTANTGLYITSTTVTTHSVTVSGFIAP